MNPKTTFVLLCLLVAGLVVFMIVSEEPENPSAPEPVFPDFVQADVSTVSYGVGDAVAEVRSTENGFEVKVGEQWVPAVKAKIEELLVKLGRAKTRHRIPSEEVDATKRKEYGLAPPAGWVAFELRGESKKLVLGTSALQRDTVYAALSGSDDVLVVDDGIWETLVPMRAETVREPRIAPWGRGDISRITVKQSGETRFSAERREDSRWLWWATAPYEDFVDPTELEEALLQEVIDLTADEFVANDVTGEALAEYGLDSPRYEIDVEKDRGGDEIVRILIGAPVPEKAGQAWFSAADRPFVYAGDVSGLLEALGKDTATYREKELARLPLLPLGRIEVHALGRDLVLVKEESDWRLEEPMRRTLDSDAVESWITAIRDLTVEEYADHSDREALGFGEKAGTIVFRPAKKAEHGHGAEEEDEKKEEEGEPEPPLRVLTLGADREGGGLWVMRDDDTDVAYGAPGKLRELLEPGYWGFVKREVFSDAPDAEKLIALHRVTGAEDRRLKKADGTWQPDGTSATAVSAVVSRLLALRAVRWVGAAEGHEAEYGLAEGPDLLLEVRFEGEEEDAEPRTWGITVGAGTDGGRFARVTRKGEIGEGVFVLSAADYEALSVPLTLTLFAGSPDRDTVTKLTRAAGGEESTWERSEGAWSGDGEALDGLVSKLLELRAVRRVGPAAGHEDEYGLGEGSALRITVTFTLSSGEASGRRESGLVVGEKTGGGRYARVVRNGTPDEGVVVIADADFDALAAAIDGD